MIRGAAVVVACAALACASETRSRPVKYRVATYELGGQVAHARGLHPAVIEYLYAAPEGPFRSYYDAALSVDSGFVADDLKRWADDARAIAAGAPVTGEHYARAVGRHWAAKIAKSIKTGGATVVVCCRRVDPISGTVMNEAVARGMFVSFKAQVVGFGSTSYSVALTWNLQYVPNAFAPDQPLDFETVARTIEPLHDVEAR